MGVLVSDSVNSRPIVSVLLVDDDDDLRTLLGMSLQDQGYRVVEAKDAESGLFELSCHAIDIALIDIRLPGMSGVELCREIRRRGPTPVVAVSAHANRDDIETALEAGADEYVAKPVDPVELSARMQSVLLRTSRQVSRATSFRAGDLMIDLAQQVVEVAGKRVDVGPAGVRLLAALAERTGVLVRREELFERIWGEQAAPDLTIVDVQAERLAAMLARSSVVELVAVPGEGYRLMW